jgi:hypothetical protein
MKDVSRLSLALCTQDDSLAITWVEESRDHSRLGEVFYVYSKLSQSSCLH